MALLERCEGAGSMLPIEFDGQLVLRGFRALARREPISGGSNHHPLCSHGSCASIDGGGIENGPPLHLPSPFEGRKKIFFAVIARIFDDQKSENFLDDFLFFAVCGVKTGQKLFLRRGTKSVS